MDGKKILIADDEMSVRLLFSELLTEEGYEVYLAANGREALEIYTKIDIDLVILDIAMPEMNGIEALRRMVEINNGIPIIFNTAYEEYRQSFATWGASDYLVKASDLGEIMECIKRHLRE
ncbi:MAG: response regulator [Desulfobaccales bacterium]